MSAFSNGLQWLKSQFEETEEERDYEEQDETYEDGNIPRAGALPARSIRPQEVVIMVPGAYGDARRAVEALEKGKTVMVLLSENVNDEVASRFVDFMSGAVCMCHGDVMLVSADVLICVPDTVDLHEDRLAFVSGIPTWKGP
ncbi:cell division protein SepF [Dialister sp.]|uniref:cell division protein SepF n=1 Tax=Dialister sp. TaxID=1955814 RepID=UPI002E800985|nr:cell division protein SepF [Dialister sp.]MEE3452729.1 cell division protein SepF [Dialister sp.]